MTKMLRLLATLAIISFVLCDDDASADANDDDSDAPKNATLTQAQLKEQMGSHKNKTNFVYGESASEHPDLNNSTKLMVEGGLYSSQKFERVKLYKGKHPVS